MEEILLQESSEKGKQLRMSEDPTPLIDQVFSGCTSKATITDAATFRANCCDVSKNYNVNRPKERAAHNTQKVSSWSYDRKGPAEECVERYCGRLKNQWHNSSWRQRRASVIIN